MLPLHGAPLSNPDASSDPPTYKCSRPEHLLPTHLYAGHTLSSASPSRIICLFLIMKTRCLQAVISQFLMKFVPNYRCPCIFYIPAHVYKNVYKVDLCYLVDRLACGGMAGFKLTVGFLFVFVCFASVPSVNGKPRSSTIYSGHVRGHFTRRLCLPLYIHLSVSLYVLT